MEMVHDVNKLINLVRQRPMIYNHSSKDGKNKLQIDKHWKDITEEMNFTVYDCRSKWANLRSSFKQYLQRSENTPNGRPRKQWYMAKQMEFFRQYVVKKTTQKKEVNKPYIKKKQTELSDTDSSRQSDSTNTIDLEQRQTIVLNKIKNKDSIDIPSTSDDISFTQSSKNTPSVIADDDGRRSSQNSSTDLMLHSYKYNRQISLRNRRTTTINPTKIHIHCFSKAFFLTIRVLNKSGNDVFERLW